MATKRSEVFFEAVYMGILVNLYLNNSFRPVKHAVKAPEHFCGRRVVVAVSAKKTKKKNWRHCTQKNYLLLREPFIWGSPPYKLVNIRGLESWQPQGRSWTSRCHLKSFPTNFPLITLFITFDKSVRKKYFPQRKQTVWPNLIIIHI